MPSVSGINPGNLVIMSVKMNKQRKPHGKLTSKKRRQLLGGMIAVVAGVTASEIKTESPDRSMLSLKEADFYRPHDLVG